MKRSEILFGLARIPIDFGMTMLAFLMAYQIRQYSDLIPGLYFPVDLLNFPTLQEYLLFAMIASATLVGIFAINQMYKLKNTVRIGNEIIKVMFLSAAWLMLIITYYFLTREFFFSRLVLGYAWVFTIITVSTGRALTRLLQKHLCRLGIGRRRILLIGNNIVTQKITQNLKSNPFYKIVGTVTSSGRPNKSASYKVIGKIKDLITIIKRRKIEEIIQTESKTSETESNQILDFCREHHIQFHFVPDILQMHRTQVDVFNIAGLPLISLKTTPLEGWGRVIKRSFDIIASSMLLLLLLPLFIIISILIKFDSRGPILFTRKDDGSRVTRVGIKGKHFPFFKFRTMRNKTDGLRYTTLAQKSHRKGSPLVKIKNDPRITRFGKLLRRWSIDELPQLFSVLSGKMSLVGPRPHLPEEVAKYEKHHKFSLSIHPGITGLAQINGRSNLNFEEEVQLDTYYIENWSIFLDIKILFRTIFVVIGGEGAD